MLQQILRSKRHRFNPTTRAFPSRDLNIRIRIRGYLCHKLVIQKSSHRLEHTLSLIASKFREQRQKRFLLSKPYQNPTRKQRLECGVVVMMIQKHEMRRIHHHNLFHTSLHGLTDLLLQLISLGIGRCTLDCVSSSVAKQWIEHVHRKLPSKWLKKQWNLVVTYRIVQLTLERMKQKIDLIQKRNTSLLGCEKSQCLTEYIRCSGQVVKILCRACKILAKFLVQKTSRYEK